MHAKHIRNIFEGIPEDIFAPIVTPGIDPSNNKSSSKKSMLPMSKCPTPAKIANGMACTISVAMSLAGVNPKDTNMSIELLRLPQPQPRSRLP